MNLIENDMLCNEESLFHIDELFVSTTDKSSRIISGNQVFVRVSEYTHNQLISKPHNLIRHPDMPKSVFKLMWNELKKDKIFCGYVKNKSKTGRFYWVFAIVYPTPAGYTSVRIKPSTELLETVKKLYHEVRKYEQSHDLEQSLQFLLQSIKDLGFQNYEHFMRHCLSKEIFSRDEALKTRHHRSENSGQQKNLSRTSRFFKEISQIMESVVMSFREGSYQNSNFDVLRENFKKSSASVEGVFSKLESLSVNMSISAHKLGKEGSTLAIVANTFQATADLIMKEFSTFKTKSSELNKKFDDILFSILSSRALIEMLDFQITEGYKSSLHPEQTSKADETQLTQDLLNLQTQVYEIFLQNAQAQKQFLENLTYVSKTTQTIKDLVTRLDLIRTGGKLEGSRSSQVIESFLPFIKEMEVFVKTVEAPIHAVDEELLSATNSYAEFVSKIRLLEHSVKEIGQLLKMINQQPLQHQKIA